MAGCAISPKCNVGVWCRSRRGVLQFARMNFDAATWESGHGIGFGWNSVLLNAQFSDSNLPQQLIDKKIGIATLPPTVLPLLES